MYVVVNNVKHSSNSIPYINSWIQILDINPETSMDTFTTGIDIFSKEEKLKMEERAKRFGLIEKCKESLNPEDLYSRYRIFNYFNKSNCNFIL